jgi:hypothetical protein
MRGAGKRRAPHEEAGAPYWSDKRASHSHALKAQRFRAHNPGRNRFAA